jgi:hypothetical protein
MTRGKRENAVKLGMRSIYNEELGMGRPCLRA